MAKILLVEDEQLLRDAYRLVLTSGGHSADVAENGEEGYKLFQKTSYDLVLLDLMMPGMDGVGFLKKVDPLHSPAPTKIIVFSNLSSGADVEEALRLGADRHVLKSGLSPDELLKEIDELIS